jgi:hypothetical protein
MNELCDVKEMIERLKDVISKPLGRKVWDSDVACVLRMSDCRLTAMKRRNRPPFKEIILFCDRCGLDPRDIVMKSC